MTLQHFVQAVETLRRFKMIEMDESGDESKLEITAHGTTWLLANFHWVRGDTPKLDPNDDAWVMAPPKRPFLNVIFGVKDN